MFCFAIPVPLFLIPRLYGGFALGVYMGCIGDCCADFFLFLVDGK